MIFGVEDQQTENFLREAKPVKRLNGKARRGGEKVLLLLKGRE